CGGRRPVGLPRPRAPRVAGRVRLDGRLCRVGGGRRLGGDMVTLVAGHARGPVLRLEEPLSFWGGVDIATGVITDRNHPQAGESVTGKVLVVPHTRGSSSTSSVRSEERRVGKEWSSAGSREEEERRVT